MFGFSSARQFGHLLCYIYWTVVSDSLELGSDGECLLGLWVYSTKSVKVSDK